MQGNSRHGKARQYFPDRAISGKERQGRAIAGRAIPVREGQGNSRQGKISQDKAIPGRETPG